jgi:hypothetical protein
MAMGWKIIAKSKPRHGLPALTEHFLVAIADRNEAVVTLRRSNNLHDAEFWIAGEATPDHFNWLDAKGGEIFCVLGIHAPAASAKRLNS